MPGTGLVLEEEAQTRGFSGLAPGRSPLNGGVRADRPLACFPHRLASGTIHVLWLLSACSESQPAFLGVVTRKTLGPERRGMLSPSAECWESNLSPGPKTILVKIFLWLFGPCRLLRIYSGTPLRDDHSWWGPVGEEEIASSMAAQQHRLSGTAESCRQSEL